MIARSVVALLVGALLGSACADAAPADPDYLAGRTIFRTCANCHGPSGEGGAGPALPGILDTFAACSDHVEWIRLGSDRWLAEVGSIYGDREQPVAGGMPSFAEALTETEIRQIAYYERVRFGELDPSPARADCGL